MKSMNTDYLIGQILEYNTVVTKAEFLFMIQSVNLPPSAHTITFSAHCSTLQPSAAYSQTSSAHTAAAITSSVHPAAMYSYLQPTFSAHCSHVQPCTAICSQPSVHTAANCSHLQPSTLQLFYPVHTAAIPSSAHCTYTTQCTLQLHYLVPTLYSTSSSPLDHHRVSLYHYWPTSRAVSRH